MGANKQTNIRAMRVTNGQNDLYVVYLTSIDLNLHPHQENECAMVMGSFNHCMKQASRFASSIPGGTTKGYSVTRHVEHWLESLCNPYVFESDDFILNVKYEKDWFELSDEVAEAIFGQKHRELLKLGETYEFDGLSNVSKVDCLGGHAAAWRLISQYHMSRRPSGRRTLENRMDPSDIKTGGTGSAYLENLKSGRVKQIDELYYLVSDNEKTQYLGSKIDVLSDFLRDYDFDTLPAFKKDKRALERLLSSAPEYKDAEVTIHQVDGLNDSSFQKRIGESIGQSQSLKQLIDSHYEVKKLINGGESSSVVFDESKRVDPNENPLDSGEWVEHSKVKKFIRAGDIIETQRIIGFGDGTESSLFKKSDLKGHRNVWFDLMNHCYVRFSGSMGMIRIPVPETSKTDDAAAGTIEEPEQLSLLA